MGRKKTKINKEEIAESFCFVCKDGGMLRICDYGDCLKVYHPHCVDKDDSFLQSDDLWSCNWHSCFECDRRPKFQCFCCPRAVCGRCLCDVNFPIIRENRGFCGSCLTLVALIEGQGNPDSVQAKIDFNDKDMYEHHFKNYWEMVKTKERLTMQQVRSAHDLLRKDLNCANDIYNGEENIDDFDYDDHLYSEDDDVSDANEKPNRSRKRGKRNYYQKKERVKSKKKEFVGWASRPLFDFLLSVGKDTSKELSQHDIVYIITDYCKENNLFDPENKKVILCDEKLKPIIGRNSVKKNNIYKHLNAHFAENFEQVDNEVKYDSGDKVENAMKTCRWQQNSSSEKKSENKETIENVLQKSCFASVISENIKHVYLRRSVVEELLKQPETFDANVMGSFVRVRSDPYDYTQKNDYQLLQVTGIKKGSRNDEKNSGIILQLSSMPTKDTLICKLSDFDFSEEECQDLQRRVKEGLVKRPTVEEFEKKAKSLHEVITKNWIASELASLRKQIDRANEKGWRRELFDYMTRMQQLETQEEQSRLLLEVPEIIAEELEVEPADKFLSQKDEHEEEVSPEMDTSRMSNSRQENSRVNGFYSHPNGGANSTDGEDSATGLIGSGSAIENDRRRDISGENTKIYEKEKRKASEDINQNHLEASHSEPLFEEHPANSSQGQLNSPLPEKQCQPNNAISAKTKQIEQALDIMQLSDNKEPNAISREQKNRETNVEHGKVKKRCEPTIDLIQLSDDEEQASTVAVSKQVSDDSNCEIWHFVTSSGVEKGPYSMSVLKEWMDTSLGEIEFKVWRTGQNPEEAVPLADAIHQVFGKK